MIPENQLPPLGQGPMTPMAPTYPSVHPQELLTQVVMEYMDFALTIKTSPILGDTVKSQIMVQMAQSISYLYPMATTPAQPGDNQNTPHASQSPSVSNRMSNAENQSSKQAAHSEANLLKGQGSNLAVPMDIPAVPGMSGGLAGM